MIRYFPERTGEVISGEGFVYIWWLPPKFPSENIFSFVFTSKLTASMSNVACSLVLSVWASVAILRCVETTNPSGEDVFDFRVMSHILFVAGAFSLRELILVASTPVEYCAVDETMMKLWANVTCFGWQSFLFSGLSSAVSEIELGGRKSWLRLSVFPRSTVVVTRPTLIVLPCGFSLSKFCQGT